GLVVTSEIRDWLVQVAPASADVAPYTSSDGTVVLSAQFPIGRVTLKHGSFRLSHQIACSTPPSAEMSGKTWCPVVWSSITAGAVCVPLAPSYRTKNVAA